MENNKVRMAGRGRLHAQRMIESMKSGREGEDDG